MTGPESLKPKSESGTLLSSYLKELSTKEHILEVREGENIDLESYNVSPDCPDEFFISETVESIIKYLNLPLVRDDFEEHENRVSWFNESRILGRYNTDYYFLNKLRLNKIQGPHTWIEHLISSSSKRRFNNPDFFDAVEPEVSAFVIAFPVYGKGTVAENLEYVEAFEALLRKVFNAMIDHSLVEGERI